MLEASMIDEDKAQRRNKLQEYILNFDKCIIKSFFSDREKKFTGIYRHRLDLQDQEDEDITHGDASLNNSGVQKRSHARKRSKVNKKDSTLSTIKQDGVYDSDDEKDNAHRMFIDDV